MLKLIQYLRGYVKIKVWGYSPERFMNLCSNHNILIWGIENHGEYYIMCISVKGFFKLRSIVRKTRTRVVILKRYGLPFFIPRIRRRSIFAAGLLGCLLFLILMSHYVWAIDITGNQAVTEDVFMDFLAENGVRCGVKKKELDIELLEKSIRQEFDVVTWTSARLDGTRLSIQIKENTHPDVKTQEKSSSGTDIIASNSGKIVNMITRSGVPQVKVEDTVEKGDVLVSGAVPIYGEDAAVKEYLLCKADADIFLQCSYHFQERLPEDYNCKIYTGKEKKILFFQLFDKEYMLPHTKISYLKSDCVIHEKQVKLLDDYYLPLSYGAHCYREYMMTEKKYTKAAAEQLLNKKLEKIIEGFDEKGVQILEKNVKIKKDSTNYILEADFIVIEKTGTDTATRTKEMETQENLEGQPSE